jgi:hypothetical protein
MKSKLLMIFLTAAITASAQKTKPLYTQYLWDAAPVVHTIPAEYTSSPAVFVKHNRILELSLGRNEAESFFTEHRIIHVNSHAGIEQFNKVYIPMTSGRELVELKVRAVSAGGKITNLKKENLKELTNVEGYGNFKIFAIEGLEVGGELEYLYTTTSQPQSYGREIFQKDVPVMSAEFNIVFPDKFLFLAKSYNGLGDAKKTPLDGKRTMLSTTAKDIPAEKKEQYAANRAYLMRVDYKLEATPTSSAIYTWGGLASRILENIAKNKVNRAVIDMLDPLRLDDLDEVTKIQAVERYIKSNFTIKDTRTDAYEDALEVISKRVGNERGMVKIFIACWEVLHIEAQLVLVPNRYNGTIDSDFPTPLDLDEILFFFPRVNQYMAPGVPYMRLGPAPSYLAGGKGLFVKYKITNSNAYEGWSISQIPPLDFTHNKMGVRALVQFKEDIGVPEIQQENFYQGHRAAQYRGMYYFKSGKDKEDFIAENTLSAIDNPAVIDRKIEGDDPNLSFDIDKYFTVKTHYTAPTLIEKAGEDYLLSVGKIIGKQSELYQEEVRSNPIIFPVTSNYNHEITIEVPTGYVCTGLDDIQITNELKSGDDVLMKFKSEYVLEGNRLTIRVNEVYKTTDLPKEKYEEFRKVVNSAADFNKLVLVLHPLTKISGN